MNQTINSNNLDSKIHRLHTIGGVSLLGLFFGFSALMSGCGQEGSTNSGIELKLDIPIAYVKRPLEDINEESTPTDAITLKPGGNLYIREYADPTSPEYNVTASYTAPIFDQDGNMVKGPGDVAQPDISYDGKRIVFAMHVGEYQDAVANPTSWNLYIYTIPDNKDYANPQNIRPVVPDGSIERELYNEFDPAFLPDGRIVFASDYLPIRFRNGVLYNGLDGVYETEDQQHDLVNLHVIRDGFNTIEQLTFNQSHDLNPSVLRSGEIIYSRWDNANGDDNHFSIYKINPDGTGFNVLYGADSHGADSAAVFLHPREMENGKIVATLMPLSGTFQGGDLVQIDYQNFVEINQRKVNASSSLTVGQQSLSKGEIPRDASMSLKGRYTTPFPLWDGSNRLLVAWAPCEVQNNQGERFFCNDQRINPNDTNTYEPAPPAFGIWMFDPADNTKKVIILREQGMTITDPIAVVDRFTLRNDPVVKRDTTLDTAAETAGVGIIKIKSVYDSESLASVGMNTAFGAYLTAADSEGRPAVDLATVSGLPVTQRAAFVRIVRPAPNVRVGNDRNGASDNMFDIVGYAPVQADGSVVAEVPAGEPFAIEVLDTNGRRFRNTGSYLRSDWLQVKAGEVLQCNGCHARRDGTNPINNVPQTDAEAIQAANASYRKLSPDIVYYQDWVNQVNPEPGIDAQYATLNVDPNLSAISPPFKGDPTNCTANWDITSCRISVEYESHLQQLWDRTRMVDINGDTILDDATCITCHTEGLVKIDPVTMLPIIDPITMQQILLPPDGQLTLTMDGLNKSSRDNELRYNSWLELTRGDQLQVILDVNNMQQLSYIDIVDDNDIDGDGDVTEIRRAALSECQRTDAILPNNGGTVNLFTLVDSDVNKCGQGNPIGSGRFFTKMDAVGGLHENMLTAEEMRMIIDWTQFGSRYTQDPTPTP